MELKGTAAPVVNCGGWRGVGGGGEGRRALKRAPWLRVCTGAGSILLHKILKSRGSEMVFSTFSMRYFLSKGFRQFLYKVAALQNKATTIQTLLLSTNLTHSIGTLEIHIPAKLSLY